MASVAVEKQPSDRLPRRKLLWIEFAAMMLALVVPGFFGPLTSFSSYHDGFYQLEGIFSSLAQLGLVLFVVWVADGSLDALGFRRPKWLLDAGLGIALMLFIGICEILMLHGAKGITASALAPRAFTPKAPLVMIALRGLLLGAKDVVVVLYTSSRLRELLKSPSGGILCAAGFLSLVYWGGGAQLVLLNVVMFTSFGYVLWKTGRISPVLVACWTAYIVYLAADLAKGSVQ